MAAAFILAAALVQGCTRAPRPAPLTPQDRELQLESFDHVWQTVRDRHWDPELGGLDWQAVGDSMRPKVESAATRGEARQVMRSMISKLGQSHFGIFPADLYSDMAAPERESAREGSPGFETRVVDGEAVIWRVDPGSPAEEAGVLTGWVLRKAGDADIPDLIERVQEELGGEACLMINMSVMARLLGPIGLEVGFHLLDENDQEVAFNLTLAPLRGEKAEFGNLPSMNVWYDTRMLEGDILYFAFSVFMDPGRIMGAYNQAMGENLGATGVVVDLRGNIGGIGGMAMGMSGWFISERGRNLGTMYLRDNEIRFTVSPRGVTYDGPVAILVDCVSASTSEIMAGGLRDLERAKVFGQRTAGAALPSMIERLPNGDGFQYAIANYISHSGDVLEGDGVEPTDPVEMSRADLLAGRDTVLEAAMAWIRSGDGPEKTLEQGGSR